jgi:hypothetical protein
VNMPKHHERMVLSIYHQRGSAEAAASKVTWSSRDVLAPVDVVVRGGVKDDRN